MKLSHLVALSLLISGCSDPGATMKKAQVAVESDSAAQHVYIAPVCDSSNRKSHVQLEAIERKWTQGEARICVDGAARIPLIEGVVKIYPISEHETYLSFSCKDQSQYQAALSTMPLEGRVALVVGDRALAVFSYLDREALKNNCGLFPVGDLGLALDFCESIFGLGSAESKMCSHYCDAKKLSVLPNVCVVGNAGNPYAKKPAK